MKKVLVLVLAVLLMVTVFGCSAAPAEESNGTDTSTPSEAAGEAASDGTSEENGADGKTLKFGYVTSDMSHEWYQNIVKGAQQRAEELGIELVTADAAMDAGKEVTQLENMLTSGVDALLITPVDAKSLVTVINAAKEQGVPVICESNVVEGATTTVGIDSVEGGRQAGKWLAEYATENNIDPKILVVGMPQNEDCRERVQGFKEALDESGIQYEIAQEVDGQGEKETSLEVSQDALTAHPEINVIFGINDNATTGGMAAYKEAGLDESKLTAIGFGFEGVAGRTALLADGPYKAAVAMFPDFMGQRLVDTAYEVVNGGEVSERTWSGSTIITLDNFSDYYTEENGEYITNFEAIEALIEE
ncbi:sugar ABC transporter substrate-binding protein [Christensenella massiliensis]|uniref:Sugar ABC transporter substrate-binding protein n=1 Tax=Christensenella massiliensis TaxID=1805714 RepID=A0AAU8A8A0_9FIRM